MGPPANAQGPPTPRSARTASTVANKIAKLIQRIQWPGRLSGSDMSGVDVNYVDVTSGSSPLPRTHSGSTMILAANSLDDVEYSPYRYRHVADSIEFSVPAPRGMFDHAGAVSWESGKYVY